MLRSLALFFIFNKLTIATLANTTWYSKQSTFRAANATWLSNHNTHHPLEIQLVLPSLVLSILRLSENVKVWGSIRLKQKHRSPNIIVLICLWQFEGLDKIKRKMTLNYANTKAFIVSQDNYMVSEWYNSQATSMQVSLTSRTLYSLPNPYQSNDWCGVTK